MVLVVAGTWGSCGVDVTWVPDGGGGGIPNAVLESPIYDAIATARRVFRLRSAVQTAAGIDEN